MHSRGDWTAILQRADQALSDKLNEYNIELDTEIFRAHLHKYYEQRNQDFRETTYHFVLRELLEELGYAEVDESVIRSALDAMYSITQTNWTLEDDTLATIQKLRSKNYQLGIFSNAGDDKDVQELIESFEIRQYFDFVLTSAGCYYRKPHPRAFEMALAQWSISGNEAVMIGDSLEADIYGAKTLEMQTIWLTRRAQFNEDDLQRIQPDFSLRSLNELLSTLELINSTRG
jgi:HAD superfamily hydrolase (TIGR01662 family)